MLNHFGHSFRKGDTLIEVMFAVGVFGLAAVGAISLMNRGLATAQNTLEITMARQEIDGQAEILRFLHSAYMANKDPISEDPCGDPQSYRDLWKCITTNYVYNPDEIETVDKEFYSRAVEPGEHCDTLFHADGKDDQFSIPSKSFVLNYRNLGSADIDNANLKNVISNSTLVHTTGTYPRLIFTNSTVDCEKEENKNRPECTLSDATITTNAASMQRELQSAEGVWVTAVASNAGVQCVDEDQPRPDFYDFHIQTCWESVAGNTPSTIGSTVRLFNPDQVQPVKKTTNLALDEMGMYFVMTWTGKNSDIDAHLEGSKTSLTDDSKFHVFFANPVAGEKKQFSFTTKEVRTFQLDVDSVENKNYNSTKDRNCGSRNCGDGAIEIIAFRSLFPATFKYYAYDFAGEGLANNNLQVRVFIGKADSGVGVWPFDTEPIATFNYTGGSGRTWDVAEFTVQEDGTFIINGKTYNLGETSIGDVDVESSCVRHTYKPEPESEPEPEPESEPDPEPMEKPEAETEPEPTSDPNTMQGFQCTSLNQGEKVTLTDIRDNNTYTVSKLRDGNCWMVKSLFFKGSSLDPSTSDVSSARTISWSSTLGRDNGYTLTTPAVSTLASGYLYSYNGATALTNGNPNESICPKGWKLPSIAQANWLVQNYNYNTFKFDDSGRNRSSAWWIAKEPNNEKLFRILMYPDSAKVEELTDYQLSHSCIRCVHE